MSGLRFSGAFLAVVASFFLGGCPAQTTSKVAPTLTAIDIQTGEDTKPVALGRVRLKTPRGKKLGELRHDLLCILPLEDFRFSGGRYVELDVDVFNEVFRRELTNNNYSVVGDSDSLFGDETFDKAEYMIGGLIKDMEVNGCLPNTPFGNYTDSTASAYMKVEWHLFDTLSRSVVYKTTSEGSFQQEEAIYDGIIIAIENSFGQAVENMLADKELHAYLTDKKGFERNALDGPLNMKGMNGGKRSSFDMVEVRPGVVTIRRAGSIGSGFFVSSNGFILTNAHVVGNAKNVRVVLHSGREVPGEVLRSDPKRDVALVKVGEKGMSAMALNFSEPKIGSEVLVYGTPLKERLEGTLTRGIVSAYRFEKKFGGRLIQSDVSIHGGNSGGPMMDKHGNVMGLSVSGYNAGGLNFFIPIAEAFDTLQLKRP